MLVNKRLVLAIFFAVWISVLTGCKKKLDEIIPDITIQQPLPQSFFTTNDTISIVGFAQDDENLKRIEITLIDDNLRNISVKKIIEASGNYFDFIEHIYLHNQFLESGTYFIKIKVWDESDNTISKFIEISFIAAEREFEGVFIATTKNEMSKIKYIDFNNNNISSYNSFSGNYQLAEVSSKSQYLFLATNQRAIAFGIDSSNILWTILPNLSPYQYFNKVFLDNVDDHLYVVFGDGRILAYNKYGQVVNSLFTNEQEWFGEILVDEYFIIAEVFTNYINRFVSVYFKTSGVENKRTQITGEVAKIIKHQENLYLVAVNHLNNSIIYFYNVNSNVYWKEIEIPGSVIYDILAINNNLTLATSSGLFNYELESNKLEVVVDQTPFYEIKYESNGDFLLLNSGKHLWNLNFDVSPYLVYSSNDSICQMMLHYN